MRETRPTTRQSLHADQLARYDTRYVIAADRAENAGIMWPGFFDRALSVS
jgi:hypothetical protein